MTQMNISIKQKQTHRHRKQPCGFQVENGSKGGKDWEFGVQTIICRMVKQQGLTVYHRKVYSVSCDKPCVYVYLSNLVVHQKLIQYCKSTLLQ